MINDDTMDNVSKTHTETLSAACRQTRSVCLLELAVITKEREGHQRRAL